MSFPTMEKSMDVPSRYEAFEHHVIGASSPRTLRLSLKRQLDSGKKKQKVSDVAVAGESPNLRDVASADSSGAFPRATAESGCPQASKNCTIEIEPVDNSATPSIEDLVRQSGPVASTQAELPKSRLEATVDLLTTESMPEAPVDGYGEANVLRIASSSESDIFLEDFSQKLPRKVQEEIRRRRTREWLINLPDEPVNDSARENDNSIVSTVSANSSQNDSLQASVLVVAPPPRVREVRIVLQRLDPQMLLKVPLHDIQNFFNHKPSSFSFSQIQKAVTTLISSAKIGLVPVRQKSTRQLAAPAAVKEKTNNPNGEGVSSSFLLRGKKSKKKRKLLTLERQHSNISEVIDCDARYLTSVECPYSPPPRKAHKPKTKQKAITKAQRPQPAVPKPRSTKDKPASVPKTKTAAKIRPQPPAENIENIRRTRSSDVRAQQSNREVDQDKITGSQSQSFSDQSCAQPEITLRVRPPRRTSFFFQPKPVTRTPQKKRATRRKRISIVGTFLHREEMDTVLKAVKKLGGTVQNKVSTSTTHVVCGGPKRTINVLRGIARGCWLLRQEWVLQSLGKGHWVDEEPFELTSFSPAVQKCRIAKETLGIHPTIFKNVGGIYVGPRTAPPKEELSELLKLCGAKVVLTTKRATVAVGVSVPGRMCVSELWVLDSIQQNILLPFQEYCLDARGV